MSMIRRLTAFSLTVLALLLTLPSLASAATINVDTGAPDSANSVTDADAQCSPREAVISANQNSLTTPINVSDCAAAGTAGGDTVAIPAGIFTLTVPGEDDTSEGGDLDLLDQTTVQGAGAELDDPRSGRGRPARDPHAVRVALGARPLPDVDHGRLTHAERQHRRRAEAGVYLVSGAPDIQQVRVFDNYITTSGGGFAGGGGIAIFGDGSIGQIEITDVTATDNEVVNRLRQCAGRRDLGRQWRAGPDEGAPERQRRRLPLQLKRRRCLPEQRDGHPSRRRQQRGLRVELSNQEYDGAGAYGAGLYGDVNGISVSDSTIINNDVITLGGSDGGGGGIFTTVVAPDSTTSRT